jgi:membrane protein DedA with SNARE-associated domain
MVHLVLLQSSFWSTNWNQERGIQQGTHMSALHTLVPFVLHFLHTFLLPALFTLLVIEEAGMPIPVSGDMLILLVGTQASGWPIGSSLAVMGVCSLVVVVGSSLLYLVMHHGGRMGAERSCSGTGSICA